jgi:hypothetical protein
LGKCYETYEQIKALLMRTQNQIQLLKAHHSDPFVLQQFLSSVEVDNLLEYYFSKEDKVIKKVTGPSVLKIKDDLLDNIIERLKIQVGNFKVRYAHFFDVTGPHVIHNDDEFDYPESYKAFTIPLKIYGDSNDIKLVLFDQYYYGGPAKFFNKQDISSWNIHYNPPLTDYSNVENINDKGIDENFQKNYLSHLRNEWLEGLSVNKTLEWKIRNVLCFDSLQLHCSTDFNAKKVERKIGLSIFTVLPD